MIKTYLGSLLLLLALFASPASAQRFSQAGTTTRFGGGTNIDWIGPIYQNSAAASASRYAYIYTDSSLSAGLTTANILRAIEFYGIGANVPTIGCSLKIYVKTTAMRRFAADSLLWDTIAASTPLLYDGNPASIINGTANVSTGAFIRFPFSATVAPPTAARPNMLVLVEYSQASPQPSPLNWAVNSSFTFGTTEIDVARPRQAYVTVSSGATPISNLLKGVPPPPVFSNPAPNLYGLFRPTVRFIYTVLGSEVQASFTPPTEYTMKPFSQGNLPVTLFYQLGNAGSDTLRNIAMRFEIKNSDSVVVHNVVTPTIAKLAPGAATIFSSPNYVPPLAQKGYTLKYELVSGQSFISNLPRVFTHRFALTSSTFARDNGITAGGLGGGLPNNVQLGVVYEVTTAEQLNSVTALFNVSSLDDSTRLVVFRMGTTPATINTPGSIAAQSPFLRFPALGDQEVTIPLTTPISLAPGRYLFALEEPAGVDNFALYRARGIIIPNTTLLRVYTSAIPSGTWFSIENSTVPDKDVTMVIRPNFTSTARVQFINNTTIDSLAIADIFLNRVRVPLVNDLRFRNATPFLANVPAGSHWLGAAPGQLVNSSRFIKGTAANLVNFQEDSTYIVVLNGDTTDMAQPGSFEIAIISGDRRVSAAGTTNVVLHHGSASATAENVRITEYGVNAVPVVMADSMVYNSFMQMGSLATINGYRISVQDMYGDTLGKYRADFLALGMGGRGITVLASGVVGGSSAFGLWVALPTGGALVPLPLVTTTSVGKGATLKAAVYPNPANNLLNIELPQNGGVTDIRLVSVQGSLVRQAKVSSAQTQLDLSGLPAGVYVLQLNSPQGQATHRIVKQ